MFDGTMQGQKQDSCKIMLQAEQKHQFLDDPRPSERIGIPQCVISKDGESFRCNLVVADVSERFP